VYASGKEAALRIARRRAVELARQSSEHESQLTEIAERLGELYTDDPGRGIWVNAAIDAVERLRTKTAATARFNEEKKKFEEGRRQTFPDVNEIAHDYAEVRLVELTAARTAEQMMERFILACRLSRSIATNLCDQRSVVENDITLFEMLRQEYQPMYALLPYQEATNVLRPIRDLVLVPPRPEVNSSAIIRVIFATDEILRDAVQGKSNLARCDVCTSVYLVTKKGKQRFCSHRCGDRLYRRNKRAEEAKEEGLY
jgi:predicted RNA-binding protein YlxR (DUF448 family)